MITINPMEEIIYEATDYCELLLEYEVFINRENIKGQLQMLREADGDKPQNNQANSSESLLTKIIDFFKRIWEKFTGKVKELSLKNSDWLKRYEKQIKEADFNNITITLIAYWNSFGNYKIFIDDLTKDTHRLINEAIAVNKERKSIANRMMDSIRETIDKLQNRISIAREEFDNNSNFAKKYSDKDGDLNKGVSNFLRVNDPKIDTSDSNNIVKLTGGEAKAIVAQMYDYCMAYSENVNNINASKKKVDNEISLIERELKNLDDAVNSNNQNNAAAQKEAFLMESIQILFEEGQDNNSNNNTSNNSGNNNNEPKNGGVQVNQDNKSMSSKELTGSSVDYKSLDAKTLSARNAALKRLQSGFAAVLTIEEEKYTRFMMIMRGIAAKLPKVKIGDENNNQGTKESLIYDFNSEYDLYENTLYSGLLFNNYLTEASHSKLKSSFRMAVNVKNGHMIRIVFGLDPTEVVQVGDHTGQWRRNAEIDKQIIKDINKKGSNDFSSKSKVTAIIDLDTKERLTSVTTIGIIGNDGTRFKVPEKYIDPKLGDDKSTFTLYPVKVREAIARELNLNPPDAITFKVGGDEEKFSYKATKAANSSTAVYNNQKNPGKGVLNRHHREIGIDKAISDYEKKYENIKDKLDFSDEDVKFHDHGFKMFMKKLKELREKYKDDNFNQNTQSAVYSSAFRTLTMAYDELEELAEKNTKKNNDKNDSEKPSNSNDTPSNNGGVEVNHDKESKEQGTKESYNYLSEMGLPTSKKPVYVILFNNNAGSSDQIKSITGFPYSHAAISLDTTMNNMYSFSNIPYVNSGLLATGNGFVRESIYSPTYVNNIFFDVFAIMVDNEKYKDIYTTIEKMKAAGPVKYRYNTLGLIDWFFLKTKRTGDYSDIKRKTSFFCSEFVAFLINGQNNMNLSPGELSGLQDIHFLKRFTIPTFKEKTLIKAVNDLERSVNKESYELLNEEFRIPIFSNLFNDDRIKEFVYLLDWKNIKTAFEVKFGNKYNDSVRFTLVEQIIKDIIIPFIDYTKLNIKRDQYTSLVTQWMSNIHAYLISERIQLLVFLNDKNLFNNFVRKFKLQY
nr:MAG TPA: Permuted papain-like amidase enzyme, YaeF/YiiX, C92 family [Caudoviricetes sp.]